MILFNIVVDDAVKGGGDLAWPGHASADNHCFPTLSCQMPSTRESSNG
jgi:hypothetical protein